MTTIEERLELLRSTPHTIRHGKHDAPVTNGTHVPDQACVVELVCWVKYGGAVWTDGPECTSRVIGAFLRSWNDRLPNDDARTRWLDALIPVALDTAGSRAVERRRAFMAADWAVRIRLPMLLDHFGRNAEASELRALPEVVDDTTANAARIVARRIADEGWDRRRKAWAQRAAAAAEAAAAAAVAEAAEAAVEAAAAAAAAEAAEAVAAEAAEAAAVVAAEAAAAAVAAAVDPKTWAALVSAAKAGGYWHARDCARRLLREGKLGSFRTAYASTADAVNASAQDLVRRMAALSEAQSA